MRKDIQEPLLNQVSDQYEGGRDYMNLIGGEEMCADFFNYKDHMMKNSECDFYNRQFDNYRQITLDNFEASKNDQTKFDDILEELKQASTKLGET